MATELQAAEVKVRIETEEAIRQVDAIEKEQMRRTAARRPGPDLGVQRPDMGASAATGAPEAAPIPATTDGRSATIPPPLPSETAAPRPAPTSTPQIETAATSGAQEAADIAGRAAQFVTSPATALGQEISAAASSAFPAAMPYLGAAGAAAAYAVAAGRVGPTVSGVVEGVTGGGVIGQVLGMLLGTGVGYKGRELADALTEIASRYEAVKATATAAADIGFAQARLMGSADPAFLKGIAFPLYDANQMMLKAGMNATDDRNYRGGKAAGEAVRQMLDDFLAGGSH